MLIVLFGKKVKNSTNVFTLNYTHSSVGVTETMNDQMKSILSQLEYKHTVYTYEQNRIPFRIYMYVPEIHPSTNTIFFE